MMDIISEVKLEFTELAKIGIHSSRLAQNIAYVEARPAEIQCYRENGMSVSDIVDLVADRVECDMSQYDPIPPHMMEAMKRYVVTGEVSSDFLIAVIDNDLKGAVQHADDHNRSIIYLYVMWFYNRAPMWCWGSRENRLNWKGQPQ